jgi:hypothetical protein
MALFSFPLSPGIEGCQTFLLLVFLGLIAITLCGCSAILIRRFYNHLTKNNNNIISRNDINNTTEAVINNDTAISVQIDIIGDDIINIEDVKIIKNSITNDDTININNDDDINIDANNCCTAQVVENYYVTVDNDALIEVQCIENRNSTRSTAQSSFLRRRLDEISTASASGLLSNRPFCI